MDVLTSKSHKARKEHKCDYCGHKIEIGEVYQSDAIIGDGGFYIWKSHLKCLGLASKLNWFDDCEDGLTQDAFIEYVGDEYSKVMSKHFNEQYESKEFKVPSWKDQLDFIIQFHGIRAL